METLKTKDVLTLFKSGMEVEYVIAECDYRPYKKLVAATTLLKDSGHVTLLVYVNNMIENTYSILDYKEAIKHYNGIK